MKSQLNKYFVVFNGSNRLAPVLNIEHYGKYHMHNTNSISGRLCCMSKLMLELSFVQLNMGNSKSRSRSRSRSKSGSKSRSRRAEAEEEEKEEANKDNPLTYQVNKQTLG